MIEARATKHYLTLDAMRGVAALNVLLFHGIATFITPDGNTLGLSLSVDFFFVLSGFVVCHAYECKLKNGMLFRNYLARRVVRLYPLAIFGTTLGLLANIGGSNPNIFQSYLFNVLALPSPLSQGHGAFPINIPVWSLFIEVVLSIAFVAFARMSSVVLGILAIIAFLFYIFCFLMLGNFPILSTDPVRIVGVFARGFAPFLLGILVRRKAPETWGRAFPVVGILTIVVLVTPVLPNPWLAFPAIIILFPLTVAAGAGFPDVANSKVLGDLSYPLYITHFPVLLIFEKAMGEGVVPLLAAIPTSIIVAWLAGRWFDIPVRAWLTERFVSRSQQVVRRAP